MSNCICKPSPGTFLSHLNDNCPEHGRFSRCAPRREATVCICKPITGTVLARVNNACPAHGVRSR